MEELKTEKTEQINESLSLISRPQGLTFGTDAYLLSAYVRPRPNGTAVELGAGTGVISLLCMARKKYARITCVEIQHVYADLIRRNIAVNHFEGKIDVIENDIRNLTGPEPGTVDAVFANPPYLHPDTGIGNAADEKNIARHELFGGISDFCKAASLLLKWGGYFTVVYRPERLTDVISAMKENNLTPKRLTTVYATERHAASLILIEAKKGAADGLYTTPPLILSESGKESATSKEIYENGAFHERYFRP